MFPRFAIRPLIALATAALTASAFAIEVPPTDDSSLPGRGKPGAKPALPVTGSAAAFIRFDLSTLPPGTPGASVARASLILYPSKVSNPGDVQASFVTAPWNENSSAVPATGPSVATGTVSEARKFVVLDVTAAVVAWLDGAQPVEGLAISSVAGTSVQFDSKENRLTSQRPRLEVVLAGVPGPPGPAGPVNDFAGFGTSGAVSSTAADAGRFLAAEGDWRRALPAEATAHIIVSTTDSAIDNGQALLNAYAEAKLLTPNGNSLGPSNRAAVILPPGVYDLDASPLVMDDPYVDLIGLSTNPGNQVIESTTSTIYHRASSSIRNVRLQSFTFDFTESSATPATYFPEDGLAPVLDNCEIVGGGAAFPTRLLVGYAGTYHRISVFGSGALGFRGTASGLFIECTVMGSFGFGGGGTASGQFLRCRQVGDFGFGSGGIASGRFLDCLHEGTGGFGGTNSITTGTASGHFVNCVHLGDVGFGGGASVASGVFEHCVASTTGAFQGSFGGFTGTASGRFYNCTATCASSDNDSFGGLGTASGTFIGCVARSVNGANFAFGASGHATGRFQDCIAESAQFSFAFGGTNGVLAAPQVTGQFINCRATSTGGSVVAFGGNTGGVNDPSVLGALFTNCIAQGTSVDAQVFVGGGEARTVVHCLTKAGPGSWTLVGNSFNP